MDAADDGGWDDDGGGGGDDGDGQGVWMQVAVKVMRMMVSH